MSVVSKSQVELVRARKALEQAFDEQDWVALRKWDAKLGECLNRAFADPMRDAFELVQEMERVLHTYATLVEAMPAAAQNCLEHFNSQKP